MSEELIFANPVSDGDSIKYFRVRRGKDEKLVDASELLEFMRAGKIEIANLELTDTGLTWYPPREVLQAKEDAKFNAQKMNLINKNNKTVITHAKEPEQPVQTAVAPQSEQSKGSIATKAETAVPNNNNDLRRINELVAKLNEARKVYEQGVDEIMSNFEYDKLYDELVALEKKTGIVLAESPTQNVGYEVLSALPKKKHETPMLSLEKTKSLDELIAFLGDKEGVLSWKLDGLTVVLTYENGELVEAVTRGNGETGSVITSAARQFKNLPKQIPFKGKLVLRGEATIDYTTFNKINAALPAGAEKYKNPRNLCSGTLSALDTKITAERNVREYIFELVSAEGFDIPKNIDDQFKFVKSLGFQHVDYVVVSPKVTSPNFVPLVVEQFEKLVENYNVPSDGLVLSFRDKEYGMSLGRTAKAYKHSIAFKWQDEEVETELLDIEWQVGRSGVITPVAIFKPVELEGSTVERASLHNISVMTELLGEPYVGQKIRVYKANMIIPQISWGEKKTQ